MCLFLGEGHSTLSPHSAFKGSQKGLSWIHQTSTQVVSPADSSFPIQKIIILSGKELKRLPPNKFIIIKKGLIEIHFFKFHPSFLEYSKIFFRKF
jgi:hypothetical protein